MPLHEAQDQQQLQQQKEAQASSAQDTVQRSEFYKVKQFIALMLPEALTSIAEFLQTSMKVKVTPPAKDIVAESRGKKCMTFSDLHSRFAMCQTLRLISKAKDGPSLFVQLWNDNVLLTTFNYLSNSYC